MGKIKELVLTYAEQNGIGFQEAIESGVGLQEMQAAVGQRGDSGSTETPRPVPWETIASYIKVALEAVHTTAEVRSSAESLEIFSDEVLVTVKRLGSSPDQRPLFELKLFTPGLSCPVDIDFKREYQDVAISVVSLLNQIRITQAIDQMEREWAVEATVENAEAEAAAAKAEASQFGH